MAGEPWYEAFFGEDYMRLYHPYLTPERTEHDVRGVLQRLNLAPGSKILDLCCGAGRHSIPLAALGYDVTGLDLSRVLLRRARVAARRAGVPVHWVNSDMRQIPFEETFDAVINLFNAFGYLETEAEDRRVLQQVYRALAPGGVFLADTISRDGLIRHLLPAEVTHLPDGLMAVQEQTFDPLAGRLDVRLTLFEPAGERKNYSQSIRFYTLTEWAAMLADAGLQLEAYCGELDGSPLALDSRHLVLLARKPKR